MIRETGVLLLDPRVPAMPMPGGRPMPPTGTHLVNFVDKDARVLSATRLTLKSIYLPASRPRRCSGGP
jgi:hypothetical protein